MTDISRLTPAPHSVPESDAGPSLVPMLVWGLVLITLSMIGVMFFF